MHTTNNTLHNNVTSPDIVPDASKSPGLVLQPVTVWCTNCCFMVQYMCLKLLRQTVLLDAAPSADTNKTYITGLTYVKILPIIYNQEALILSNGQCRHGLALMELILKEVNNLFINIIKCILLSKKCMINIINEIFQEMFRYNETTKRDFENLNICKNKR